MSAESVQKYRQACKESDAKRDAGLVTPEDITRFDDIIYGDYGKETSLDVYCPKGTDGPLPVIVSIHGGGWTYGDKELYQHYCMRLAQRGFTVVNFTYRLAPENRYPAVLEDCFSVFSWIMKNGADYYMDLDNIFMVGDSAGGQLAHQVCCILTNPEYAKLFNLNIPAGFKINACALNCGCYKIGPPSILKPVSTGMMADYLPEDKEEIKRIAPQLETVKNTTAAFPPAFVMSAEGDFLKMMAKPMYNTLKKLGVETELHIYGDKQHKLGHVFHVNCRLPEAVKCNDDECGFFRRHIK